MSTDSQEIVVQDVLDLLKKGYTRLSKDDMGNGSIQGYYNLTGVQVKELFTHPKLRQKKTISPKVSLIIVDRETAETPSVEVAPQKDVKVEEETIIKKDELFN